MYISFRQGIVKEQSSPSFLQLGNNAVSLLTDVSPVLLTFAYQNTNYLFMENESIQNAWIGPFTTISSCWLYWDINLVTAVRTFGYTTINPFSYGNTFPTSPQIGQHFYNYSSNMMNAWNGGSWISVLRVFAGQLNNGNSLTLQNVGSQVNINQSGTQGFILFDQTGSPFRNNSGYFLTTESIVYAQNTPLDNYKIEGVQVSGRAVEPIPQFTAVTWSAPSQLGIASYTNYQSPAIGIAVETMAKDQVGKFVTNGYITNPSWNFTDDPNTSIWVGENGELTTDIPQTWSMQKLGIIINSTTVFINIENIILLGNQISFPTTTPTPTVTPTITATPSITATNTPTITPTLSSTITPTVSSTITITPTLTSSTTPTPTFTVTPSVTTSPEITSSAAVTITPSPTPSITGTPAVTLTPIPTNTVN